MAPTAPIDRPGAVRPGEGLDREALARFLAREVAGAGELLPEDVEVRQFPAGYSNLTYAVSFPADGGGRRELVLRRPPFGSAVATAHDMAREHRILSRLEGVYPKAPRPVVHCQDERILGAPFYLMERVEGAIPRAGSPPDGLPGTDLGEDGRRGLSEAFVDALAELHGIDVGAAGLLDLGRPEGYVERQVFGWTKRYRAARSDDVPSIERAADWLAARVPDHDDGEAAPSGSGAALVHNDFKLDNLVLDPSRPSRIRAVLDWEMATVGNPRMDLGSSLAYWIEADDPPELRAAPVPPLTTHPGALTRSEVVARWSAGTGRVVGDPVFYFVYGLLKLAGILQQIYVRYLRGATADPRFAGLIDLVRACGHTSELAIRHDRIDRLGG